MKFNFVKFHIIPIILSLICIYTVYTFIGKVGRVNVEKLDGVQSETPRIQANYSNGVQGEINFVASLQNKNAICFLGSSEFGNDKMKYFPYDFLKDSLNMNVFAFGHAHHQCFSMYTQLLAAKDQLQNANVCIILSPSWFITEGTNIEAFLEFVPEHFLKRIIHNPSVTRDEKLAIAEYIYKHFDLINKPTLSLSYFYDLYKYKNYPFLERWVNLYKTRISDVRYNIQILPKTTPLKSNKTLIRENLKHDYLKGIKSNKIYVNDEYYSLYLSNSEHPYEKAIIEDELFKNRTEFNDFKLLIKLLKDNNCKASFIFQPLNNYHYQGLEKFTSLKKDILLTLKQNNFPLLDMFSLTKDEFEPGVLNDIMHTGDYGWSKINQFMYTTYYKSLVK
jgi:D-alanine transfer protein